MFPVQNISLDSPSPSLVQPLVPNPALKPKTLLFSLFFSILAGLVVGFLVAQTRLDRGLVDSDFALPQNPADASAVKVGSTFGAADEQAFRDEATGILKAGGLNGEGSHHLERGANASQWVYLTSSVVDLDLFVNHEVTVWGETFQGKKAGWLMDVGRLKVLKLNAASTQ